MTAAAIVRSADETAVQSLMQTIAADAAPAWQRSAMLRGAEVTLLAAAMPGGGGGGRGAGTGTAPDARPGSRSGPGGAPAFARTEPAAPRAANVRALKLGREPALMALAAQDKGEFGTRAAAVLARVAWPGKPPAADAAPPLTAEEQQRFEAGREVYQSLCSACHQPDGAGRENVAPSLIGSDAGAGRPRRPGPHRAQRQGRTRRLDAATRIGPHRRPGCGGTHLHPARVGPLRQRDRAGDGWRGAVRDQRPHTAVDRRPNCSSSGPAAAARGTEPGGGGRRLVAMQIVQDLAYGARLLLRHRGFTAAAVATLCARHRHQRRRPDDRRHRRLSSAALWRSLPPGEDLRQRRRARHRRHGPARLSGHPGAEHRIRSDRGR